MQTFYSNSVEGCVLCGSGDLPQGGNWIVSDNAGDIIDWIGDCGSETLWFKVSGHVLMEVASEFDFR